MRLRMRMRKVNLLISSFVLVLPLIVGQTALAQRSIDLTVEQAVATALEDGLEVAEAQANLEAAESAHKAAKALFGPRVVVDASAMYFNERPTFDLNLFSSESGNVPIWLDQALNALLPEGPIEAGEQYNVDFRVAVVQPLTKLEAIAELSKIRSLDVEIAGVNSSKTNVGLAFDVREASYQLLKIQESITTLEETEEEVLSREKQVKAFREAELVGPEQVLEISVKLAEVRQGLIKARAYESVAQSRIGILLRLEPMTTVVIAEPEEMPPLPDLQECIAKARENRPEVQELRLRNEQAEVGIRAKMQEWVPDISLVASYQYQAGSSIGTPELAVGAVLSWTPFAWGETYYAVQESKARARQVGFALERVGDLIGLDVHAAHAAAYAQRERIALAQVQVEQAQEFYRIERARFDVRDNTATDLLSAATALYRARSTLEEARYDYLIALAALRRSMGEP